MRSAILKFCLREFGIRMFKYMILGIFLGNKLLKHNYNNCIDISVAPKFTEILSKIEEKGRREREREREIASTQLNYQ